MSILLSQKSNYESSQKYTFSLFEYINIFRRNIELTSVLQNFMTKINNILSNPRVLNSVVNVRNYPFGLQVGRDRLSSLLYF